MHDESAAKKLIWLPLFAAICFLVGCANGHFGTVAASYTSTPRALFLDAYAIGLDIRPHPETRGATLGYSHTTYFFEPTTHHPVPARGRWFWFHAVMPQSAPLATASSRVGLDLGGNSDTVGFAFGLSQRVAVRVPLDGNACLHLRYRPGAPDETISELEHFGPSQTKAPPGR